jgi:glycosyltransferase involved in cell wall biosynthesis
VAPTRHALFRALAERVDLTVLFMARTEPTRGWSGRDAIDYPHEFLGGLHVPLPGRGDVDAAHLNPGVVRALWRGRYDALLCGGWISPTTWLALVAAKRARTRFVLWSGTAWPPSGARSRAAAPIKRAVVRAADGYVAYGELARERLVELGADYDRVTIALNTTDVAPFAAAARPGGPPTALWVGRFVPRKRADLAVEVLAATARREPDLRALFVGDGPERARTEALARAAGLDAHFLGDLAYDRLPEVYARAHVLLTLAEREPWGLVVNEALAAGVPVLASTQVPAAVELVPRAAGRVSDDRDELAAAAAHYLRDAGASDAARRVVPLLSPERWADAVVQAVTAAGR